MSNLIFFNFVVVEWVGRLNCTLLFWRCCLPQRNSTPEINLESVKVKKDNNQSTDFKSKNCSHVQFVHVMSMFLYFLSFVPLLISPDTFGTVMMIHNVFFSFGTFLMVITVQIQVGKYLNRNQDCCSNKDAWYSGYFDWLGWSLTAALWICVGFISLIVFPILFGSSSGILAALFWNAYFLAVLLFSMWIMLKKVEPTTFNTFKMIKMVLLFLVGFICLVMNMIAFFQYENGKRDKDLWYSIAFSLPPILILLIILFIVLDVDMDTAIIVLDRERNNAEQLQATTISIHE